MENLFIAFDGGKCQRIILLSAEALLIAKADFLFKKGSVLIQKDHFAARRSPSN